MSCALACSPQQSSFKLDRRQRNTRETNPPDQRPCGAFSAAHSTTAVSDTHWDRRLRGQRIAKPRDTVLFNPPLHNARGKVLFFSVQMKREL